MSTPRKPIVEPVPALEGAAAGAPAPAAPLPCLYGNNSTEEKKPQSNHVKSARALAENCRALVEKYGLERIGFLTLTFYDHVTEHKEAQRRFNSLATHVLRERYADYIKVSERQQSGRWHFHLLVVLGEDIRTGFDFDAYKAAKRAGKLSTHRHWTKAYGASASARLREEWRFWREVGKRYAFGRVEMMPIKSTAEGVARYIGKYIGKHMHSRKLEDKGVRLVACSHGARVWRVRHAHNLSPHRFKLRKLAAMIGAKSMEDFKVRFGEHWGYILMPVLDLVYLDPEEVPSVQHWEVEGRSRGNRGIGIEEATSIARQLAWTIEHNPKRAYG
jgi:hypothetical protein